MEFDVVIFTDNKTENFPEPFRFRPFGAWRVADELRKHGYHVNSNYDADRMMLCVRLIEKVQNEDYMMEMINDDNITKEKLQLVKQKQEKAKRILFKLLDKHIESWWD